MIKTRVGRDKFIDGLVISFLAAACAATIALNIGLSIGPGKILPTDISMRTGDLNENIIAGIQTAEEDIGIIKSGLGAAQTWMLISDRNLDLFFLIALLLPQSLTKAILTVGYFLRFGAAAAMMYAFCCRHTGLRRLYSFLLGMMYALSSQIILTAQFAPVMNMVILLPAALSAFDTYLRERTWKAFGLSSLACALIAASGHCGCISGIPFLAVAAFVLPVGLYSRKRKIFSSWLKLLGAVTTGAAMASFTVIPRFIGMTPKFDVVEEFKTAEMRYMLYDLLRHTFVAQSGGLERDIPPVFYIGILTVEAVVLFWANFKIPVRMKVTAALVLAVWHISCASSFVSGAVSIFGESATLTASRLICLEVFIFIFAAIALRNINGVSSGALYAAFLVPVAFLVFSGNFYSDIKFSTTINLGTAIVMFICGLVIRRLTLKSPGKKFKIFIASAGALAVTVNASFIMFNNTISTADTTAGTLPIVDEALSDCYIDPEDEEGFTVFAQEPRYVLLSEDISEYRVNGFADGFNYMARKALAGDCFDEYKLSLVYSDQADNKEGDIYTVGAGFSSITFEMDCEDGDRLFVYSGFNGDITYRNTNGDFEEEEDISGPALRELDGSEGRHELAVYFDLNKRSENRLAVLKLRQEASDKLEDETYVITDNGFDFGYGDIPGARTGTVSFITSLPYDQSIKISVNGKDCRTFNYLGLTGCVFEASENISDYSVRITRSVPGLAGGISVSAAVCFAVIAIPLIYKYTNKNNKKGKGSEGGDDPELPCENAE